MGKKRKLTLFMMAILSVTLLTGCGYTESNTGTAEEAIVEEQTEETWLQTYTVSSSTVTEGNEAVLSQQEYENGFLAYINRKVREEIPTELKSDPDFVNDGRYDIYESSLFTVTESGKRHMIRRYRPRPAPENTENLEKYFSESRPRAFRIRDDGGIVALENSYESWRTTHGTQTRDRYYVRLLKENGVELSCFEVETTPGEGLDCGNTVLIDDSLLAVPQGNEVLFFGLDGKKQFSVSTPFRILELCKTLEGNLAVLLTERKELWISVINISDRTVTVPQQIPTGAHSFCAGEAEDLFYFLRNSDICYCDLRSGMSGKKVSLLTLEILPSSVSAFSAGTDGSFRFLIHSWDEESQLTEERYLTASACEIQTGRLLISIGFDAASDHLQKAILAFNQENRDIFLDTVDYRNLEERISSDHVQDIMVMDEEAYNALATSGSLLDLERFLQADRLYSRDNLFPSVYNALSDKQNVLRRLAASFRIETMACDHSVAEGQASLSVSMLRNLYADMPARSSLYEPYYTAERLLEDLMAVNSRDLGEGDQFNIELYAQLLNFSNLQSATYSYYDYSADSDSMEKRIYDGRLLMLQAHIATLDDLKCYDSFFENGASFVGWPTEDGSLSRICFDESLGISSDCSEAEQSAAWQFVRLLLQPGFTDPEYGFPVIRETLEEQMTEDAEAISFRLDEDGKYETDKNGNKIEIARDTWYSAEGRRHFVYALTDLQREKLLTLIENCI